MLLIVFPLSVTEEVRGEKVKEMKEQRDADPQEVSQPMSCVELLTGVGRLRRGASGKTLWGKGTSVC